MQKTVLSDVYDLLKEMRVVDSESEFSKDWLGRSECYMRTLRFKGAAPSMGSIAICASKLQHYGRLMQQHNQHRHIGEKFVALSELCNEEVMSKGAEQWVI